jgi:hypothetical protein
MATEGPHDAWLPDLNGSSHSLPELDPVLIERLKISGLEPLFEKLNTSLRLSQERLTRLETRWLANTPEVAEFLHSHLSRCDCPAPAATRLQNCQCALNRLMAMLGCRNPPLQSCEGQGPIATLVADFDQHLTKVCGLSLQTRFYRRRYAREFLA